jgi:hypothetical protein
VSNLLNWIFIIFFVGIAILLFRYGQLKAGEPGQIKQINKWLKKKKK